MPATGTEAQLGGCSQQQQQIRRAQRGLRKQQRQGRTLQAAGGDAAHRRSQRVLLQEATRWCHRLLFGLVPGAAAAGAGVRRRSRGAAARARALRRQQQPLLRAQGRSRLLLAVVRGVLRQARGTNRRSLQLQQHGLAGARARGLLGRVGALVEQRGLVARGGARANEEGLVCSTCMALALNKQWF
jgi:hypothetical protein